MMQTAAIKEKLLNGRANSGNGAAVAPGILRGTKLAESGVYLKSARMGLVNWTKEVYANSDTLEMHVVHVQEVLRMADQLEDLRAKIEAKASLFGI
jgi:hypothetical protein